MRHTASAASPYVVSCFQSTVIFFIRSANPADQVNKYIGDATLCVFDDSDRCLAAAKRILLRHEQIQRERRANGKICYEIAIGLSYGKVLLGNFGNDHKLERTVVGDAVNVCQRIESLTRSFSCDLLASGDFINSLSKPYEGIRLLTKALVKGKSKPIEVFEVYSHLSDEILKRKNNSIESLKSIANRKKANDKAWRSDFELAIKIVEREKSAELQLVKKEEVEQEEPVA